MCHLTPRPIRKLHYALGSDTAVYALCLCHNPDRRLLRGLRGVLCGWSEDPRLLPSGTLQ